MKRSAGKSPDELAQLAHESGFIESDDPAALAEALSRDLAGEKIYTPQGHAFERRMDIQIEREFQRWAKQEEAAYYKVDARARAILEKEDLQNFHRRIDGARRRRANADDPKRQRAVKRNGSRVESR